jgi:hypothetical protein
MAPKGGLLINLFIFVNSLNSISFVPVLYVDDVYFNFNGMYPGFISDLFLLERPRSFIFNIYFLCVSLNVNAIYESGFLLASGHIQIRIMLKTTV